MPLAYTPPLQDIRFVLTRLIGLDKLAALPPFGSVGADIVDAVLGEVAKIAAEQFGPLNERGDKTGARFEKGKMSLPDGFKDAYQAFVDGGWNALPVETVYGGQGLPWLLAMSMQEMLQGANIGLALCPLLNQGAIELLCVHGDEEIKKTFLPKLVSGEWTGTMNLTEPQAGSDVGAVKTRAVRDGGTYRLFGQKIFISYGDHDLTENIIHLVLARLPEAPEGIRGLSLFLVPKILVREDGSLGEANDVRVVSIEHKLGQHSSPTCVMAYGDVSGAVGYLVGKENGGIAAMFTMMNNARISVGIQGLGLMERAYQQAKDFAKTRVQSRPIEDPKAPPVTIIHHPDVRRMLLFMKAHIEASRALAYSCGLAVDIAKHSPNKTEQMAATARVDFLTPIVKAWLTDLANEITSLGVQVFGGMGYIEETGAAQHMRDARILSIYEGTNGIQANDLIFRKMSKDGGASFYAMMAEVTNLVKVLGKQADVKLIAMRDQLAQSLTALESAAFWVLEQTKSNPVLAASSASVFLRLCGNVLGGFYLIRSACLAKEDFSTTQGDEDFLASKIHTALFYSVHVLAQSQGLAEIVKEGGKATADGLESLL